MVKSAYSPIKHLANALFFNHDPKRSLMAIFSGYFDASRSHEQTKHVITMAGFVTTETKWLAFEKRWNAVLKDYEVPYLHMKEFAHSVGAFKTWKGQEEKRKQFLIALIQVAKNHVNKGSVFSVGLEDFEDVNKRFRLLENWGSIYAFAGMAALTPIMRWKEKRFPGAYIKYFFEDGDEGRGELKKCLDEDTLPYAFTPKKEVQNGVTKYITPFQFADFAAYENRAAFDHINKGGYDAPIDDPLKKLRLSFQALVKQMPCDWMLISKTKLEQLAKDKGLMRGPCSPSPVADSRPTFEA